MRYNGPVGGRFGRDDRLVNAAFESRLPDNLPVLHNNLGLLKNNLGLLDKM